MSVRAPIGLPFRSSNERIEDAPVRVLVVCPIGLYRDGIAHRLRREPDFDVVGPAADAEEAAVLLREFGPAVVLLDAGVPDRAAVVKHLLDAARGTTVVALALDEREEHVLACAEAGIEGYVPPDASLDDLVAAVRRATRGEVVCPPHIVATLFRRVADLAREREGAPDLNALTPREREVVGLLGEGLSNKAIARRLGIGVATVKNHVHRVLEKLGVPGRDAAAARAHELGLARISRP